MVVDGQYEPSPSGFYDFEVGTGIERCDCILFQACMGQAVGVLNIFGIEKTRNHLIWFSERY